MLVVKNIYTDVDLHGNELKRFRFESLASDPDPIDGGVYYNTTIHQFVFCLNGVWTPLSDMLSIGWTFDEQGNLVTDSQVVIKNNAIIEGDTASGGEGEDNPVGLDEAQLKEYLDSNKYVTEDDIEELIPDVDLSGYYTAVRVDELLLGKADADNVSSEFETLGLRVDGNASSIAALSTKVATNETDISGLLTRMSAEETVTNTYKTWWENLKKYISVVDGNVQIDTNLIVSGDTASGGAGEDNPVGIQGVRVNNKNYDDSGDGYVDLSEAFNSIDVSEELENYYTKGEVDSKIPSLNGYAKEEYVDDAILDLNIGQYAKTTDVNTALGKKQNTITDLETIRSGAALGATALQSVPSEYITENELSSSLANKADKTRKVSAGTGLTGGGDLTADRTISLATVSGLSTGTYTKVTVDTYGRVTSGTTLSANDIPLLEISKINDLQGKLDNRYTKNDLSTYKTWWDSIMSLVTKDGSGNIVIKTNLIVEGDTASSGSGGTDVPSGGGGITLTDVAGYLNEYSYVNVGNASELGIATQSWVEGKKYVTGITVNGTTLYPTNGIINIGTISIDSYTKAEIDTKVASLNSNINSKLDSSDLEDWANDKGFISSNDFEALKKDNLNLLSASVEDDGSYALYLGYLYRTVDHIYIGTEDGGDVTIANDLIVYDALVETAYIKNLYIGERSDSSSTLMLCDSNGKLTLRDKNYSSHVILHEGNWSDYISADDISSTLLDNWTGSTNLVTVGVLQGNSLNFRSTNVLQSVINLFAGTGSVARTSVGYYSSMGGSILYDVNSDNWISIGLNGPLVNGRYPILHAGNYTDFISGGGSGDGITSDTLLETAIDVGATPTRYYLSQLQDVVDKFGGIPSDAVFEMDISAKPFNLIDILPADGANGVMYIVQGLTDITNVLSIGTPANSNIMVAYLNNIVSGSVSYAPLNKLTTVIFTGYNFYTFVYSYERAMWIMNMM